MKKIIEVLNCNSVETHVCTNVTGDTLLQLIAGLGQLF